MSMGQAYPTRRPSLPGGRSRLFTKALTGFAACAVTVGYREASSALPWNPESPRLHVVVDQLPVSGVCVMNDGLVYPFRLLYLGVRVTPRFCVSRVQSIQTISLRALTLGGITAFKMGIYDFFHFGCSFLLCNLASN